jgi:choline dehydrogenase-like flavoprotein
VARTTAVVLAAGIIESTRLALLSFPADGGSSQLAGRNLVSHIRSNMYFKVRRTALDPHSALPAKLETAALLVRGAAAQGKFQIQVTASADEAGNSDALLYAMIPDIDQLDALLAMQESGWISFAFRGASELKGDKTSSVPNGTGHWINLSPFESDEFGMRRAYVQFNPTAQEQALASTMENCMVALANALANGNPNDLQMNAPQRDPLGSTYHESGTLWMGTDPLASVTDTNGKFHNLENAYCTDQALFVSVGSVNPTLTGLVLTRKVSEAVIARANNQPAPA